MEAQASMLWCCYYMYGGWIWESFCLLVDEDMKSTVADQTVLGVAAGQRADRRGEREGDVSAVWHRCATRAYL